MRNRTFQINVRLTAPEKDKLFRYAKKCNLSTSGYIRMLINGYIPKEAPTEQFTNLTRQIIMLNDKLMQNGHEDVAKELRNTLLELKTTALVPEKLNVQC